MDKYDFSSKDVKSVSFNSNGIYNIGYTDTYKMNFFQADQIEIENLMLNLQKVSLGTIEDSDIVYFDKGCSFPKLLLSRLKTPVKRTTKKDKATKIIINDNVFPSITDFNVYSVGYMIEVPKESVAGFDYYYIDDNNINRSLAMNLTLEQMQAYFPGKWQRCIKLPNNVTESAIQHIQENPDILVTVQEMAVYLNRHLPEIDEESAKTMISLMSANSDSKKLALDIMINMNVSSILFDLCESLGSTELKFDPKVRSSINYKYFKALIGINPTDLQNQWNNSNYYRWWRRLIPMIAILYNKGVFTKDQKKKAWEKFFELVRETAKKERYDSRLLTPRERQQFQDFNIPFEFNDEN